MKYYENDYAESKLTRTFIFQENKLFLVVGRSSATFFLLRSKDFTEEKYKLKSLDLTPPVLGYVNHGLSCCYASRIPMRRDWRQGIRPSTLNQATGNKYEHRFAIDNIEQMFCIEHTCQNMYPSLYECINSIEEYNTSCAFSRVFALNESGDLTYKGFKQIGKVKDSQSLVIKPKYSYLLESLEENLVGQNVEVRTNNNG